MGVSGRQRPSHHLHVVGKALRTRGCHVVKLHIALHVHTLDHPDSRWHTGSALSCPGRLRSKGAPIESDSDHDQERC